MTSSPERPWLARRAADSPDREALRFAGRSVSYADLDRHARRLGRALGRSGVAPGDRVAVAVAPGASSLALLHALVYARAVLVPLNLRLARPELEFVLRDCAAGWLLVDGREEEAGLRARAAAARAGVRVLALAEIEAAGCDDGDDGRLAERVDPGGAFAILYTSGTSGRPKGAVLCLSHFRASADASARILGVDPADRWLLCLPLFHVGGLSVATRSVLAGTSVLLHSRFDPVAVNRDLDGERATLASFVSTMLARVLDARADGPAPPHLRAVLLGGGPTPPALVERARKAGFPVAPTYGLTEATSQVATRPPAEEGEPLDGRLLPLPGTRVRVVDERDRPLAPGRVGEICVRGPTVMRGYWGRPEESAQTLRGGWLHTGDLGVLDPDGRLRIVDRRSDLIVSGGENVYPAEVESVLSEHPDVAEVAVAGRPDPVYGQRPVAWFVARPDAGLSSAPASEAARRLDAHCRARLAGFKVPVRFRRVATLPRTATGKVRRRDLPGD